MKRTLFTILMSILLSLTAYSQDKIQYDDNSVTISTTEIECGSFDYVNFTFVNKTPNTVTITYVLELKMAGELNWSIDNDHNGVHTIIINPNGTVSGSCGSHDYLQFLGKTDGNRGVAAYKITNVQIN